MRRHRQHPFNAAAKRDESHFLNIGRDETDLNIL